MSRPNGRRKRAIEGLAAALQECFDASIEVAEKWMEPRFDSRQQGAPCMPRRSEAQPR